MRIILSVAIAGIILGVNVPAMADTDTQSSQGYVPSQSAPAPSLYNAGPTAKPYVAGKNAPSYSYNTNAKPFGFDANGEGNSTVGSITPEQAIAMRAQRDAQAQAYEKQYLENLQKQRAAGSGYLPPEAAAVYQTGADGVRRLVMPEEEKPAPKKRRVVKREQDNPLSTPPRLFNVQ